jgi:hypothetical protein
MSRITIELERETYNQSVQKPAPAQGMGEWVRKMALVCA